MHRLAEIQLHRRQQRFRRVAARRADRRGQFGAQARGPDACDLRPCTAARKAIARCATSWSTSSSATPALTCTADDILVTSGSLQALDLVNGVMLAPRRHRDHRAGLLPGLDQPPDAARRQRRSAFRSTATACGWTRWRTRSTISSAAASGPKFIYTIPTVQNPTGTILPEARRVEMLRLAEAHGVPIFEDDCYCDLIWDHKRPPALHAMSKSGERHPHRLVLQVDRPRAARRLHRRALGASCRACCRSSTTRAPARWSRWCSPNTARRISPSTCRC